MLCLSVTRRSPTNILSTTPGNSFLRDRLVIDRYSITVISLSRVFGRFIYDLGQNSLGRYKHLYSEFLNFFMDEFTLKWCVSYATPYARGLFLKHLNCLLIRLKILWKYYCSLLTFCKDSTSSRRIYSANYNAWSRMTESVDDNNENLNDFGTTVI
jgi:hypothetical protein